MSSLPLALLALFWILVFLILIGVVFKLFGINVGEMVRSFREGMKKR